MWTNWGYFKMCYSNGKLYVLLLFKKCHCEIPKKCYFWLFVKIFKDHTYYMMRKGKYKTLCYVTVIIIVTFDCHII